MASWLDKDHTTTKKNGATISEPHMPGPCFGSVLVAVSRVTSDLLPAPPQHTDAQVLVPSSGGPSSGQTWGSEAVRKHLLLAGGSSISLQQQ